MKILTERYPLGSLKHQQTAGRYIDQTLYENLKPLARSIKRDMTFLGIISSSTLEVGTGKSVLTQQICEAYLDLVKQYHNIDNRLAVKNLVFKPQHVIDRAFKIPRYSCIIIDEWEDANYWSTLGITLRQFFRKCRQLNLFILLIIPNFFQLPMGYAVSRSIFFIDVKFQGEFERGYFAFYNFQRKKDLYIKGKKTHDYGIVAPNFQGRFVDGYVVDEAEYRRAKLKDMMAEENQIEKFDPKKIRAALFCQVYEKLKGKVSMEVLSNAFGVTDRTASRWYNDKTRKNIDENERETQENEGEGSQIEGEMPFGDNYFSNITSNEGILEENDVDTDKKMDENVGNEPENE